MVTRIDFVGSPRIAPDQGIVVDALVDGATGIVILREKCSTAQLRILLRRFR